MKELVFGTSCESRKSSSSVLRTFVERARLVTLLLWTSSLWAFLLWFVPIAGCSEKTAFAVRSGDAGGGSGDGGAGGGSSGGGSGGEGGSAADGGTGGTGGACTPSVRITEIDVGVNVAANEDERALSPIVISPLPSGGARLAWMYAESRVHVAELDASDHLTGQSLTVPAHDLADLHADEAGGVLLVARDAEGGGNNNCGTLANLCGTSLPSAESCFDMHLVRFDGESETWAAKLTDSSAELPPYSTSPTGPDVLFAWSAYAHHGRIAFGGARYAAYFGVALSTSETCTNGGDADGRGINIYQGDRMKLVSEGGTLEPGGFDFGCSVSGYERVLWDPRSEAFVAICKTQNRISLAPPGPAMSTTIAPLDPFYGNVGNLVLGPDDGYWLTASNLSPGEPPMAPGLADVHLFHFSTGMADRDLLIASDGALNERAPHLAPFGENLLLAAWETSPEPGDLASDDPERGLYVQAFDAETGDPAGESVLVTGIAGNRYQDFRAFPDGSVAYASVGSSASRIKILRVLPCGG